MKEGRALGLDYGTKRIGVASGDLKLRMAFPRLVIKNEGIKAVFEEINALVDELGVTLIVVGLPLALDGHSENKLMNDIRYFVKELRGRFSGIEVEFLDERYSSFEADELMEDISQKGGDKIGRDAYAAQVILQRFFDTL